MQAIWSLDKNQPLARIRTLEEIVDRQLSTSSQSTALLGAFALLALLLASLGIYGVLSYAVTQRTSEIGVRMALGATSGEIMLSFGRRGLALTLTGLAIGLVPGGVRVAPMTTLLYGFRPTTSRPRPWSPLILMGVAALAMFRSRAPRLAHRSDDRAAAGIACRSRGCRAAFDVCRQTGIGCGLASPFTSTTRIWPLSPKTTRIALGLSGRASC